MARRTRWMIEQIVGYIHADHLHAIFFRHIIPWLMSPRISSAGYINVRTRHEEATESKKKEGSIPKTHMRDEGE